MTIENIVVWIVIGGIAGLLADAFVGGIKVGIAGAIAVGILGAFIGGWLLGLLGLHVGSGIVSEIVKAFIGAVVLLVIMRSVRRL